MQIFVKQYSYLRITLDQTMSFIPHINNITLGCSVLLSVALILNQDIGVARGGQGRAFARPSLNFALPSKVAKQVN